MTRLIALSKHCETDSSMCPLTCKQNIDTHGTYNMAKCVLLSFQTLKLIVFNRLVLEVSIKGASTQDLMLRLFSLTAFGEDDRKVDYQRLGSMTINYRI